MVFFCSTPCPRDGPLMILSILYCALVGLHDILPDGYTLVCSMTCCYTLLFHNLLNMKYLHLFMLSLKHQAWCIRLLYKIHQLTLGQGEICGYRYVFVFTVVLGCALYFRSYLRYSRGPRGVLPPFLFYCHDKGIHKTLMLGLAAGSVFKQRNNTGPWSRACTGPTVNIVRRYNRCFQ